MSKEKIKSLNEQFRIEELQQRLEYKVTKPGRQDWYDGETTITTTDSTGTTTTATVSHDW